MNKEVRIDNLVKTTGDPFADTGGYVIEQLWKIPEHKNKNISDLIEYVAKVYVNRWDAKLHAFFLNSKITQAAFKGQRKIDEAIKYYKGLLEETEPYEIGYCRILGIKTKLFSGGRDNHILSGSGTFINFHHSFQNGVMLSKEVLIRMFFVPFGAQQLSDKVAILSSNSEQIFRKFVRKNVTANVGRIGSRGAEGMLRSEFNNPASALFDFVHSCLTDRFIDFIEEEDVEINLYHFTNFGASPEVIMYNFSSPLFSFYRKVLNRDLYSDWQKFVRKNYYNSKHKDANYDLKSDLFISDKKKTSIEYEQYKTWVNWIYRDLIKGESLVPKVLRWTKENSFNFKIVRLYQNHLKNMDEKTLDKIEQLAEFILLKEDILKQRLTKLNSFKSLNEMRRWLIYDLIKENHSMQNQAPLFSMEEYVNYLFPENFFWKEIRDLLVICIFQKAHEKEIWFDTSELTEEIEIESKN